jgi:hypothetical protein
MANIRREDNPEEPQRKLFEIIMCYIGCSFKIPAKVGVEESIVNASRITDHGSAV